MSTINKTTQSTPSRGGRKATGGATNRRRSAPQRRNTSSQDVSTDRVEISEEARSTGRRRSSPRTVFRNLRRRVRGAASALARGPVDLAGDLQEHLIDGAGAVAATALRAGGAERAAAGVQRASRHLGDKVDRAFDRGQQSLVQAGTTVARQVSSGIASGARATTGVVARGARLVGHSVGTAVEKSLDISGDIQEAVLDVGGAALGSSLELVGAGQLGGAVRRASSRLGDHIDGAYDVAGEHAGNFTRGFTEGAAGAAEGLGELVANPLGTVQAVGQIVEDPSLLLEGYRQAREQYGVAGALGAVTFDVLGTAVSGGGTAAARVSSNLGRLANTAENLGSASRLARGSNTVARGLRGTRRAFDGYHNFRQRRWSEHATRAANALHGRAFVPQALPRGFASLSGGLNRVSLATGRVSERVRQALPGSSGLQARVLRDTTARFEVGVNSRVNAFKGELDVLQNGVGAPSAAAVTALNRRIAQQFSPQEATQLRRQVRDLVDSSEPNWGDFERNLRSRFALDFAAENEGLARRLDSLSNNTTRPDLPEASVLAEGRVDSLRWIRDNAHRLSDREIAQQVTDIFTNSNPRASVSILQLPTGSELGRVYSSNATGDRLIQSPSGLSGSYFSSPSSLERYSSRGHQEIFALPNENLADRAALVELRSENPLGRTVLASQTAPQLSATLGGLRFGQHAIGGDWQFRLFDNSEVRRRLKHDEPTGVRQVQLPSSGGVRNRTALLWQLRALRGIINRSTDTLVREGRQEEENRLNVMA